MTYYVLNGQFDFFLLKCTKMIATLLAHSYFMRTVPSHVSCGLDGLGVGCPMEYTIKY
jgi:hypothetical protein